MQHDATAPLWHDACMASKKRADGRTSAGRFAPGKSGNPSGAKQIRIDDWQNFFTGLGMFGKDKRIGSQFNVATLSFQQLQDLWLGDDLASRAVETIPREALRQGYDVSISSGEDKSGAGDQDPTELASEVQQKLAALGVDEYLETCGAYERGYGGAALLVGANDGQEDLTKPLNLAKIRSLDWLTPLEPRELMPLYAYGDPRAPKYGQPEIYQLSSRSVLPSYSGLYANTTMQIHESRLITFPGIRVSRYQTTTARGGWGEAVLSRVFRVLRDFNSAWASAGVLVTDFAQSVIKIAGLWEALALDGEKAFQNRLAAMEYGRGVTNAVTIDAGDSYERQQTPLSGLPDLLEKFAVRLAAACDMPLTLLFGTSPAGMNATGESDVRFFYDRVAAYQHRKMEPALRRLCQIIFRTVGSKVEPDKWSVKFRPLWQDSAKDKAAAMLTQAQADVAWIGAGVISPEEVASSHWGKGEYDPNLTIDFDARDDLEPVASIPVDASPKPGDPNYVPPPGMGPDGLPLPPTGPDGQPLPPPEAGEPDPNTAPTNVNNQAAEDHADDRDDRSRFAGRGFGMPAPGQSTARASHERAAAEYADKVAVSANKARIRGMHASAHASQGDFEDYAAAQRDAITHQNRAAQAMSKVIYHATRAGTDVARGHAERAAQSMAGPRMSAFQQDPDEADWNPPHVDEWSDAAREAALEARQANAKGGEADRHEIHVSHGMKDPKGREIGGRSVITKEGDKHFVNIQATRNGEKHGALNRSVAYGSHEEAVAAAKKGLVEQHRGYEQRTGGSGQMKQVERQPTSSSDKPAAGPVDKGKAAPAGKAAPSPEKAAFTGAKSEASKAGSEADRHAYKNEGTPEDHAKQEHLSAMAAKAHGETAEAAKKAGDSKAAEYHEKTAAMYQKRANESREKAGGAKYEPKEKGEKGKGKKEPKEKEPKESHLLSKLAEAAKASGSVVAGEGASKAAATLAPEGGEGGEE